MLPPQSRRTESLTPILILGAGLAILYLFWNVFLIFILAAFFAFLIHPIVRFFERRLPHVFSIIIVYLLITIALIIVIGLLAPLVSAQSREFLDMLPAYVERSREIFESFQEQYGALPPRWRGIIDRALLQLQETAIRLTQERLPAVIAFFGGLLALIFVPLLAFFMLLDHEGYKRMILAVTPRRHRRTIDHLFACTGKALWNFVKGRLILMTSVGLVTGFGLYLVGMPYAAVFGIIAGVLEVVPTFGPTATSILVAAVALLIDPLLALEAVAVTVGVQVLENIFLSPLVMAKAVGMHPVTVVFALFVGGNAAGILGALVAIPLAMVVKIVVLYFYVHDGDLPDKDRAVCLATVRPRRRRT